MLTAVDLLKVVQERGAVGFDELEAAIPAPVGTDGGFLAVLDAAVDHGFLRCTGNKNGLAGGYCLTRRGRSLLQASSRGAPAA